MARVAPRVVQSQVLAAQDLGRPRFWLGVGIQVGGLVALLTQGSLLLR